MGIFILIIIILVLNQKKSQGQPLFRNPATKNIIFAVIALMVISTLIQSVFSAFWGFGRIVTFALGPLIYFGVMVYIVVRIVKSAKAGNSNPWQSFSNQQGGHSTYDGSYGSSQGYGSATGLVRSAKKRSKILHKFNKKYGLCLTEQQEKTIVDASYVSSVWAHEISAMQRVFESLYEWFTGETAWLRVYLYAFKTQTIVPDLNQQGDVCLKAFCEVLSFMESAGYTSMETAIEALNRTYYTTFDSVTIMIAHQYAASRGHSFKLPIDDSVVMDEMERLKRKYQ